MKTVAMDKLPDKTETSDLHESFRCVMQICRWVGFFPVDGLDKSSIGELKFNMRCVYGIFHGMSVLLSFTTTMISIYIVIKSKFSLGMLTTIILVVLVLLNIANLNTLARNWPYLMKRSIRFERELTKIKTSKNVSRNCKIIGFIFLLLGFGERAVYLAFQIDFVRRCMGESSITYIVIANAVVKTSPTFFSVVNYNTVTAIVSEICNLQSVFVMNFMDIMLMIISYYLSSYFQDLNRLVEIQKNNKSTDWGRLRRYYSKIACMVKLCDSYFSFVVLISMASNLFFICLQLFNTLNLSKDGYQYCKSDESIYDAFNNPLYYLNYSYAFFVLVLRWFVLTFMAADVHSASQQPLIALGEIHSSVYGIEIERFKRQITYTNIGIGGIFFNVTRQLILKVFATMITYELVMVQFAQMASEKSPIIMPDNSSLLHSNTTVF